MSKKNKDSSNGSNVIKLSQFSDSEEDRELKKLVLELEELHLKIEKSRIKLRILTYAFAVFIITIIFAGITDIMFPKYSFYTSAYLTFCNILSAGLCIYNCINLFKNGLIKQKVGKWLMVLGIVGVLINVFAIFNNYFIDKLFII